MRHPVLLYRPPGAWVGDAIPAFHDGAFHVYYLWDDRDARGAWRGLDWAHLRTDDLVHFEEQPVAIQRGSRDDIDLFAGTGSVATAPDGRHVVYYTAINPRNREPGRPREVVMRAFSRDLVTWQKDPGFVFEADPGLYERDDWRDPFVIGDGSGMWRMLLCARIREGPDDRRGAIGLATSSDMMTWEVKPPLLAPGTTTALECPDLFVEEGDSYLLYSTYSDRQATLYRRGGSMDGPWVTPTNDALDAPDAYAMKTVSDGDRRYLIGWLATRAGDRDGGHRQWGGDLIAHEVFRRSDGDLGVGPTAGILASFEMTAAALRPLHGTWDVHEETVVARGDGLAWANLGEVGDTGMLDVSVALDSEADEIAIVLRADDDLSRGYYLRLDPGDRRFVFDRRPHPVRYPFEQPDRPHVGAPDHEVERPLRSDDGWARIRIVADESAIIVYVNDVALSTRGYDISGGVWGLVVAGGSACFRRALVGKLRA